MGEYCLFHKEGRCDTLANMQSSGLEGLTEATAVGACVAVATAQHTMLTMK